MGRGGRADTGLVPSVRRRIDEQQHLRPDLGLQRRRPAGRHGTGQGANFSGAPGLLRLFNSELGGQISWLLPAAVIALVVGIWRTARRPRTDRPRAALILWGGWLVAAALVFSFMSGVIHPYYANLLAPPIAVIVGVVTTELWARRDRLTASIGLALMLIATAAWSYVLLARTPEWHPELRVAVLVVGLLTAVALVALTDALGRRLRAVVVCARLAAALAAPAAYTLGTAATAQSGSIVAAGPASSAGGLGGGFGADGGLAPGASSLLPRPHSPPSSPGAAAASAGPPRRARR